MSRPLPEQTARSARAYLAGLVPPDELSDAWHELLEDVAYWGDRDLVGVMRLATYVLRQHQRITDEVAALGLLDVGIDDPGAIARILEVDGKVADTLAGLRDTVDPPTDATDATEAPAQPPAAEAPATGRFTRQRDPAGGDSTARSSSSDPRRTVVIGDHDGDHEDPAEAPTTGTDPGVRIGFDDDAVQTVHGPEDGQVPEGRGGGLSTRQVAAIAVGVWVAILILWLIL